MFKKINHRKSLIQVVALYEIFYNFFVCRKATFFAGKFIYPSCIYFDPIKNRQSSTDRGSRDKKRRNEQKLKIDEFREHFTDNICEGKK